MTTFTTIAQKYTTDPATVMQDSAGIPFLDDMDGTPTPKVIRKDSFAAQLAGEMTLQAVHVYTSNDTWTKPSNIHHVVVEAVGSGGGGGGVTAASGQCAVANGGGGGCYKKKFILAASLGATEAVTVGAGGTAGAAGNNNGGDGNASSFGAHISAAGGGGGDAHAASATLPRSGQASGGEGGGLTGALGDVNIPGCFGVPGACWATTSVTPSIGGASHMSGTVKNAGNVAADEAGEVGAQYGGGGSGARSSDDTTNRAGGAGAAGVVIVWEYGGG